MSRARDIANFGNGIDAADITDATITADKLASGAVEGALVTATGRRNLIINGDFQVSQRGDYSSAVGHTSGQFAWDRWHLVHGASANISDSIVVLPNGNKTTAAKIEATSTVAGSYLAFKHVIEDYKALSGKTITISAWVKTNNSGFNFRHDSTTSFGSTFTADGNWHYVSETYTCPTITAAGRSANETTFAIINYGTGGTGVTTGDYIEIAQVQLEVGSVATPFEHRSYGEELALCQRYYERVGGGINYDPIGVGKLRTTTQTYANVYFKVTKRAAPSVTLSGTIISTDRFTADVSINGVADVSISERGMHARFDHSAYGADHRAALITGSGNPSGYLAFDAEL